jgi:hypothetical protein
MILAGGMDPVIFVPDLQDGAASEANFGDRLIARRQVKLADLLILMMDLGVFGPD